MVKYVTPLLILFVEIAGVIGKIGSEGAKYWWVIAFSLILVGRSTAAYLIFFRNGETGCNADELEIEKAAIEEE